MEIKHRKRKRAENKEKGSLTSGISRSRQNEANEANEAFSVNGNVSADKNKKKKTGPPFGGATASVNRRDFIEPFNRLWEAYPKRRVKQVTMKRLCIKTG